MTTSPTAGSRIKAANTPAPYLVSAIASNSLATSSTTAADIPGATITFTTANANASVMVVGVFDAATTTTGGSGVGTCVVDGTSQSQQAIHTLTTANGRETISQCWNVSLASAGPHTIKLQGAGTGAGTVTFGTSHTTITALVLDW